MANDIFVAAKKKEVKEVELLAKNREKLTHNTSIKFNKSYIRLEANNNIFLGKKRECQCLRLVELKEPVDLVSSRGKIRKWITPKDQYVAQCACGAYIAIISQPEAIFNLSYAFQVINPKKKTPKHWINVYSGK